MRCDHCGKEIDRDSEFCKFCGGAIVQEMSIDNVATSEKSKPKSLPVFVKLVVSLGAAGLIFILPVFLFGLQNPSKMLLGTATGQPSAFRVTEKLPESAASSVHKNPETMSYGEYTKIKTGMTYDEVCEIIGSYGDEMARTEMAGYQTVIVGWEGEGTIGANANVTFQNGKVITKAQAGLQ
ncbi:MAG TPA: DUF3862 domain-containing protein [Clostridia bacterium]|nr:DUF3862 domain-containing protein [Clostridia bacterium]